MHPKNQKFKKSTLKNLSKNLVLNLKNPEHSTKVAISGKKMGVSRSIPQKVAITGKKGQGTGRFTLL